MDRDIHHQAISLEALAHLGDGEIAYVKAIRSEDVPAMFPQAPRIAPGLLLFALHAADGTPIIARPERAGVRQNADNPSPPQYKPAADPPPIRAEQVPH